MAFIIFGSLLLILATFLPSFLEAGALLGVALSGERHGELNPEDNQEKDQGVASTGAVVAVVIIFRTQIVVALSAWLAGSLYNGKETNLTLMSGFFTGAFLLGELLGKLIAIRFPAHARRAVQPLRRLLARGKSL